MNLTFDSAGGDSTVDLFLTEQEYDQCRQQRHQYTCTDQIVFASKRSGESIQGGCNHTESPLVLQIQTGAIILVIYAYSLKHHRSHDSGFQKRKNDLPVNGKVGGSVNKCGFIQRYRNIFHELDEDVDGDNIRTHTHNDVTIQMIDKSKVTHDLVYRDLHGNSGKESCKQEQTADQSVAGELESVQYIKQAVFPPGWILTVQIPG